MDDTPGEARCRRRTGFVLAVLSALQLLLGISTLSPTAIGSAFFGLLAGIKCARGLSVSRISLPSYIYATVNGLLLFLSLIIVLIVHATALKWCNIGKLRD